MLMAVALAHLDDPENATAAYEQAVNLDTRDPAVPLNFAVFLGGLGNAPAADRFVKCQSEKKLMNSCRHIPYTLKVFFSPFFSQKKISIQ